ncbi:DUF4347 domain-containing protein [Okeania sp. SIO2B3]|uniref:DUF4347 domain-containing protein n=1 Tax=Okeania sp. SIO2B3 TaxID=2607784 RepID=UPI0013BFC6E8|nr:DUF4347 domain-containing protein [Okeania sp. SIO2B3]NET45751.1 DUF4347 domain-containing protein [Okeania sp. SIO2B3]
MNQTKLLFIDSKVESYHHLIPEVDPQTKIVILEPNGNGIDQISKSLCECLNVETIHIISHGAKGALSLGNSILKNDNIHLYAESIQKWGKCLSASGEILIYGCQVASGQEGREFVRQLHKITGANIAASETLTGNVSRGGNWNLEVIFGQLKSALAFTPEVRASYPGVLANIVVDTTDDVVDDSDGVTSLREAIIEANSTPEDDTIQLTAGATYNLTISGSDEDAAATGDLDILAGGGEITVISQGEEKAVIDAGGESGINDRVFHVVAGGFLFTDGFLLLENVEVTGGRVSGNGGGIKNSGTLTINNSIISNNSPNEVTGVIGYGSGIYNSNTLTINNSTITGNLSTSGGGIHNVGIANINNSNISGNSASLSGGGIFSFSFSSLGSTTNISNSTISGNSAYFGGGIDNDLFSTVNISNTTISGNSVDIDGGGINNTGTVIITNSTISDNSAFSSSGNFSTANAYGGGIFNRYGSLSISNSNISSNSASLRGGGIANLLDATVNISDSTISDNSATDGSGGGILNYDGTASISNSTISGNSAFNGGGISNLAGIANISDSNISSNLANFNGGIVSTGTSSINNSTISGNSAGVGGGIFIAGTASISNSTISGNSAGLAAGIYNLNSGTASISNSTITGNSSFSGASGIKNTVGGTTIVTSSIVSGNANIDVEITQSGNILISGNNNLIGTVDSLAINSFNGDRDQVGVTNPLLGELTDNGGPTLTHLPLSNSSAIDAGSNPNALTTDQRGEPRFAGEGVDIGAVEVQPQSIQEIIGTAEADFLNGTTGQDSIFGLDGNDVINGLDDDDVLFGNRDLDTINGDAGNDTIFGGRDEDLVFGNIGEDFLRGDRGSDSVFAQEGNDTIFGGRDNDFVDGGFGNDSISGDLGSDTLIGGQGIDTLSGGNDADIFELAVGEGLDIIIDFVPGQDIILLDKTTFSAITSDSGTGFSVDAEFAIVTSDSDAETSEAVIVYNSNNGKLFYNANGTAAEFGSGGEFANLTNTPSISENDFLLRE